MAKEPRPKKGKKVDEAPEQEEKITPENLDGGNSVPENTDEDDGDNEKLTPPAQTLPSDVSEKDWLQKYQVRTIAGQQIQGGVQSNPAVGSDAENMKKLMLAGPKIRMFFPLVNGEAKSSMQTVNINGYRLDFPKQAYVDVPELAANVLMESLQQTEAAVNSFRIAGDEEEFNK